MRQNCESTKNIDMEHRVQNWYFVNRGRFSHVPAALKTNVGHAKFIPGVPFWHAKVFSEIDAVIFPINNEKTGSFLPTSAMTHPGTYNPM